MAEMHVMAEREIAPPPERVYGYIADFRDHNPPWLPPAFSDFQVERGGIGAGTVTRFRVRAGGRSRAYQMWVNEPIPGRVLTEPDTRSSLVTTFTVTPDDGQNRVRSETRWQGAGGIGGVFERLFAPRVMRKLYAARDGADHPARPSVPQHSGRRAGLRVRRRQDPVGVAD